jgi:hypothetical protein
VLAKLKAISKRMGQALGRIGWYPKHHLRYYSNELGKDYEHQTPPPQNFHTHNQFQQLPIVDNHMKNSKKSPIYQFQLLIPGIYKHGNI